jgi:hypothetical protein
MLSLVPTTEVSLKWRSLMVQNIIDKTAGLPQKYAKCVRVSTISPRTTLELLLFQNVKISEGVNRRKIRLIESNAKCRYLKKLDL